MSYIKWDDSLLIGIEEVDKQHRYMFTLINKLHDIQVSGHGAEVLDKTMALLVKYVYVHFSSEESFMQQHNYPGYEGHKKEHEEFINKVTEFQLKHKDSSPLLARDILMFLGDWYREHIVRTDKLIGEYLKNQI